MTTRNIHSQGSVMINKAYVLMASWQVRVREEMRAKKITQEQLAELAGTNKSYISKLERNLKDIRFSTLQRIINDGLGGHLDIAIRL